VQTTATVEMDGQEIRLIIEALNEKAYKLLREGKTFESSVRLLVAEKLDLHRQMLHESFYEVCAARYGLERERASFCRS
jgi:hypothetical protein